MSWTTREQRHHEALRLRTGVWWGVNLSRLGHRWSLS
jgi:hypothetical protein